MSNVVTVPADKLAELQREAARFRWLADRFAGMKLSRSERWLSEMSLDPEDTDKPLAVIVDAASGVMEGGNAK